MAKLIFLALAFTTLVALATAHSTIVTTTVEDENPIPTPSWIPPIPFVTGPVCRVKLMFQDLDQCQEYLQQGQSPYELNRGQSGQQGQLQGQRQLQQCCQQLQNVERRCQCEAVKQVLEEAQQQGQQGQQYGIQQQLERKAQNLPQQCGLQLRQDECQISTTGGSYDPQGQQCSSDVQGQRFNQCQRFIQSAQRRSPQSPRLQQRLQQCCNELENVQRDCHCEALEQVYRQAIQQQQQQGGQQQQPWQQQGDQQQQPWQQQGGQQQQQGSQQQIGQAIETIRNQCNLQVHQCRIPSAMF